MTYDDISPAVRGFLGGWEALRKLGFRSGDIYFMTCTCVSHSKLCVMVALRTQGKEFHMEVAHIESEQRECAHYRFVAQAILDGKVAQADLDRIWQESEAFGNMSWLEAAIVAKGLIIPGSAPS